jgi:predicted tellurium resistance membrane protein TerC
MPEETPVPGAAPGGAPGATVAGTPAGTTGRTTTVKPSDDGNSVEKTRAWTGLIAVVMGDLAIALAAILGVVAVKNDGASSTMVVSILSSAFTAVGTLTTAYFGIKATANTAKNSIANQTP